MDDRRLPNEPENPSGPTGRARIRAHSPVVDLAGARARAAREHPGAVRAGSARRRLRWLEAWSATVLALLADREIALPMLVQRLGRAATADAVAVTTSTSVAAHDVLRVVIPPSAGVVGGRAVELRRGRTGPRFCADDEQSAAVFASRLGLVLRRLEALDGEFDHRLAAERQRIAQELSKDVTHRLFGLGLAMSSLSGRVPDVQTSRALDGFVGDLDRGITAVRSSVYALRGSGSREPDRSLHDQLRVLVEEFSPRLGCRMRRWTDNSLDAVVEADLGVDLIRAVRSSLFDVARCVRVTRVSITVRCAHDRLELVVTDDGTGRFAGRDSTAEVVLGESAARRGGSLVVEEDEIAGRGRRLRWSVPLVPGPGGH